MEVANDLKKKGGSIIGIRPGRPTADYIRKILSKVTLMGAFFLSIIAILPIIVVPLCMNPLVRAIVDSAIASGVLTTSTTVTASMYVTSFTSSFSFGGTSLLIVIGVALETARDLEAQLSMRNYKGFLD